MFTQAAFVLSVLSLAHSWSGFKGIPGQYCKVRPGTQCCENREDDCTVSILGNHKCYCDKFCHREHEEMHGDCCPDYEDICGAGPRPGLYPDPSEPSWTKAGPYDRPYPPPRQPMKNDSRTLDRLAKSSMRHRRSIEEEPTDRPHTTTRPFVRAPGVDPDCKKPCTCPIEKQTDPNAYLWCCCEEAREAPPPPPPAPVEDRRPVCPPSCRRRACPPPRPVTRCGAFCHPQRHFSHQRVPYTGRSKRHMRWGGNQECCTVLEPQPNNCRPELCANSWQEDDCCCEKSVEDCPEECEEIAPPPTPPIPPTRSRTYTVTFAPQTRTFAPIIITKPPEVYTLAPRVMTFKPFPPLPQPPRAPLCPVGEPCCESQCCCDQPDYSCRNQYRVNRIQQQRFHPNRPPLGFQMCSSTESRTECAKECSAPPQECCPGGRDSCCDEWTPDCPPNPCCGPHCSRPEHTSVDWNAMNARRLRSLQRSLHRSLHRPCEDHTGRAYSVGQRVLLNCKTCTCSEGGWAQCQPDAECLIQNDLLVANRGGRYTWQASNYSMFWGKSLPNGIKYRLGTLYPDSTVQNMHGILAPEVDRLPDEFDSRQRWPGFIGPVRDQGDCGSSWAFSTVTLAEDRLAILSEGKLKQQLSVQQLLSCNQDQQRGCDGGYLDRAWWYIRRLGVVSEDCYPYESGRTQTPGTCQIGREDMKGNPANIRCPQAGRTTKVYRITPSYRLASKEEDIRAEIFTNGPVQATFRVYEDFYMYKSGVYQTMSEVQATPNDDRNGYHSVRLLGWGVDRSTGREVKYWLAANSWGTEWGEQGLFKILRGQNHCEIESFVISALGQGAKKRRRRLMRKMKRQRVLKL